MYGYVHLYMYVWMCGVGAYVWVCSHCVYVWICGCGIMHMGCAHTVCTVHVYMWTWGSPVGVLTLSVLYMYICGRGGHACGYYAVYMYICGRGDHAYGCSHTVYMYGICGCGIMHMGCIHTICSVHVYMWAWGSCMGVCSHYILYAVYIYLYVDVGIMHVCALCRR